MIVLIRLYHFSLDPQALFFMVYKLSHKTRSLSNIKSIYSRTNIGNAKLFGLEKSLGLKGQQYNVALCEYTHPPTTRNVC